MEVFMDLMTLKKKLSTYATDKGYLKNVSDDISYEVLKAWEEWTAPSKEFYQALGFSYGQLGPIIGKGKKLKREGYFAAENFKQIDIESSETNSAGPCNGVEVIWKNGQVLRFSQVDFLIEFLKKVA